MIFAPFQMSEDCEVPLSFGFSGRYVLAELSSYLAAGEAVPQLATALTTVSLVVRQILTLKGRESQSSRQCVLQSSAVDLV